MKKLIFTTLFIFTTIANAGISKPTMCMVLLQALKLKSPEQHAADRTYVVNSFTGVGERILNRSIDDVKPNAAEGTISPSTGYSWGFSQTQAAGRIRGIRDFANAPVDVNSSERKFTLTGILSGEKNIQAFVDHLLSESGSTPQTIKKYHYATVLTTLMSFLGVTVTALKQDYGFTTVFGALSLVSLDMIVQYARTNINSLQAKLLQIRNQSENFKKDKWLLTSLNFNIMKEQTEKALRNDGDLNVYAQEELELTSPILKTLGISLSSLFDPQTAQSFKESDKRLQDRIWVGVDFLLTNGIDDQPELLVVVRGSHKAPPFPKSSPKPEERERYQGVPTGAEVPAAIPVRD